MADDKSETEPKYPSKMAEYIFEQLYPAWTTEYLEKNAGYPELDPHELGPAAEFVEIWRKAKKLKYKFWDEKELGPEDAEQVARDMIGHCFQLLYIIEMTKPGYVAAPIVRTRSTLWEDDRNFSDM